jgi:hypothetical protein
MRAELRAHKFKKCIRSVGYWRYSYAAALLTCTSCNIGAVAYTRTANDVGVAVVIKEFGDVPTGCRMLF